MNAQELTRKVRNFETIASQELLSAQQRAALREEVSQLHEDISPSATVTKYAVGGAAAGVVLPIVGIFSGGAAGAVYGALQAHRGDVSDARRRLETLLTQLA